MKRCPSCHRTYEDDTLAFCLEDGSALVGESSSASDQPATIIMNDPRITIPGQQETASSSPPPVAPPQTPRQYIAPVPAWSPQPAPHTFPATATRQGRGLAITSLVCAIIAFVLLAFCFIGGAAGVNYDLIGGIFIFAALLGLVGAVLGIIAVAKASKDTSPHNSKPMAIVAFVLNGVFLLITIIILVLGAMANS